MTVSDAQKFLKENFDLIKNQSLEGCPSALAWLPENSDIRKTYGSRMHSPWQLCLGRRKAWSMSEAVLRHSDVVNSVAFSPDGLHIVSASNDHTARIWNTITGECEEELKGHTDYVNSAVFSPNGMFIVIASNDSTARIWNAVTGECEAELKGHSSYVTSAVFSPDGMHILTASWDETARIWNTVTRMCETELKEHTSPHAEFASDGMHIVIISISYAQIWNKVTEEFVAELNGHTNYISSAVFSPDSKHIVTASSDRTARI